MSIKQRVLNNLKNYCSRQEDIDLLNDALDYSRNKLFRTKYLKTLTLYTFLTEVVESLMTYNASVEMIVSTLIFKVDKKNDEEIKKKFGNSIYEMVIALRKMENVKEDTNYEIDHENFKKILVALANDYRVVIIKLVIQYEIMKNFELFDSEKEKEIINDSIYVYSPLAHRLGIFKIKNFLENMALFYKDKESFNYIKKRLKQQEDERLEAIETMKKQLIKILAKNNIEYVSIKGRPKQIYSIYNKMKKKNIDFDDLYDLLALRVITKSEGSCYEVLGHVHTVFRPIQGKFKDYIAVPKANMYQSLHTSVVGKDGNIYEIQIRTEYMDEVAESGVAAHWRYKEDEVKKEKETFDEKLYWFKDYINSDKKEEVENLKKDIFDSHVAVLTPKGKVIDLPKGSTSIDFAYRIHSKVGDACVGALVNGKMVPLETKLNTGDVVEIRTSKIHTDPSEDWLKFVKTSAAKTHIKKALQKKSVEENKEQLISNGKQLLLEQIKKRELDVKKCIEIASDPSFLSQFSFENIESLYLAISNKAVSPMNVVDKIRKKIGQKNMPSFDFKKRKFITSSKQGIVVEGVDGIKVSLSQCCSPLPGDEIIGFISRGKGVKVHRKDCEKVKDLKDRIIDVSWDGEVANNILHKVYIIIIGSERRDLIVDIMGVLSTYKVNVLELNAVSNTKTLTADIHATLMVQNNSQYQSVSKELVKIKGVYKVERVSRY